MTRRLLVAAGLLAVTACITRSLSRLVDWLENAEVDWDDAEPCCATPDQMTP